MLDLGNGRNYWEQSKTPICCGFSLQPQTIFDAMKKNNVQPNKYGVLETNQPHPPAKTEISRGTVLQILREGSDHYQRYEAARVKLRKELGWAYLPVETRVKLDLALKKIDPIPPHEITAEFVEMICGVADRAKRNKGIFGK